MAFKKPTLNEIADRIKNDIVAKTQIGNPLKRSFVLAKSYALAGAAFLMHSHIEYLSKQIMPDTAEKEYLDRWASIWGVTRKAGSFCERDVQFTGVVGAVIEQGAIVQDDNGNQFQVDAEVSFTTTTATVHVVAVEPGTELNILEGAKVALESPISGVESQGTVLATGFINGQDEETDSQLAGRLLERIQQPPAGGKASDFILWAKEVAGVTRSWVYPERFGPGTVGVSFVTDNDASLIPTAAKVTEVQDYIDELRPVTAEVTVFAPVESQVDFTIQLNPNTSEVQEAVTNELKDLINRVSEPEGRIYISHVREAISTALGEDDHVLVTPNADIIAGNGEIKTLGTITFQNLVY